MSKEINNESQIKIAVNVFVFSNKKILLYRRVKGGEWCLPGGHFEYGESLTEAAHRELQEETGITADNLKFLHVINDPQGNVHYVHVNFSAENWRGEPILSEPEKFSEWGWFDVNNLPQNMFSGHKKFIPAYLAGTNFFDNK
ncbi:MAG: Hydrolase, NUDIX family [Parcubacteria group bacterium GW2011_GWC1_45_9]|uniref:Hydrolase, NUDIX family n=1 Tax=Candidatus Woesebacteria bacterium GW2011_GWB1_44_11b TaxID=1618580 RepID=A0A0G1GHC6_9BACT|nr:MAG: Hydrolase, NUDIX family [Candidatus Woesebacteria bacterium GW2011_GWB1_44_11b]KKU17080.1 MAG: Hydrolase, NUDIX family [Parcubacteria group bacterium GW2011_GWC1_45_9]HCI05663.1 DNA mismatch repair protein MutT [Patescibacteria group bacterium]